MTDVTNYQEITGDLIQLAKEEEFDAILHGCNCFNTMGAGIAAGIKLSFPDAYAVDKGTLSGDKNKLGTYSIGIHWMHNKNKYLKIINAYTQFSTASMQEEPPVDYYAIENALTAVNKEFKWQHIGMPLIGCGLAGGDWDIVKDIIKKTLTDVKVTIVHYRP
jgi:O-acetyl-ADP-ribose deacetylase (regulator of RNase III)